MVVFVIITGNKNYANQQHHRSRSFDASVLQGVNKKSPTVKSNLFSGFLNRIRQVGSPNNNNNGTFQNAPPSTPVSTILVTDSSGCDPTTFVTTTSPTEEELPNNKTKNNDASASNEVCS
jgi:hypothetical protein